MCLPYFQWHSLDRSEQAKYYEMARKEKELHQQLYPGWSARDNYAAQAKKKKRKKEFHPQDQQGTLPHPLHRLFHMPGTEKGPLHVGSKTPFCPVVYFCCHGDHGCWIVL